jgi:CxxC motif-containing protein (DUF1111 family)
MLHLSKNFWANCFFSILSFTTIKLAHADVVITLQDSLKNPIPGVSCGQEGEAPVLSDGTGKVTLHNFVSILTPESHSRKDIFLTQKSLVQSDFFNSVVYNTKGQKLLDPTLGAGQRILLSRQIKSSVLKKRAATGGATPFIICSKEGFVSQGFNVTDGINLTVDFSSPKIIPLFNASTKLAPEVRYDRGDAIITEWGDRARDRHAKEDQFQSYDHYLTHYWEHRTARTILTDRVTKGGNSIDVSWVTEWKLDKLPEFRAWYSGKGSVAQYYGNYAPRFTTEGPGNYDSEHKKISNNGTQYKYTYTITSAISLDGKESPLAVGQFMEIEASQFLDTPPVGRDNYYGTVFLYEVGKGGMVPWYTVGDHADQTSERENSHKIDEIAWLGGRTTLPYQYSDEPDNHFLQMATNISGANAQPFVLGRRVLHTNFITGEHDEPDNPIWTENIGKGGNHYISTSCNSCHIRNGRGSTPLVGKPIYNMVVKVGDAKGNPHPKMGGVLQPQSIAGAVEGYASILNWIETDGLRKANYSFAGGPIPTHYSVRASPQLVGMGLLEAIPESTIQGLADPDDLNKDNISGRMNIISDPKTSEPRLGRFGWKAGKVSLEHQIAGAFNTDMGVMTSLLPKPDCGSEQTDCDKAGSEIEDSTFKHIVTYISLLGIRARRDYLDPVALQGEALFTSAGCTSCHIPTLKTSAYHPKAELRNQIIHPFTDLLLHDMGPGLADNLPEGMASGSEWRTPALWGIGLSPCVTGGVAGLFQHQTCTPDANYLHDGRARTLEEAILWHGGEASSSTQKFKAMSPNEVVALIKFLNTL